MNTLQAPTRRSLSETISQSRKGVLSWEEVSQEDVPKPALDQLKINKNSCQRLLEKSLAAIFICD